MLLKANLRISQMVALLGVAGLFLCCVEMTRAQSTDDDSRNVVEIPAHELSQIKEELKIPQSARCGEASVARLCHETAA